MFLGLCGDSVKSSSEECSELGLFIINPHQISNRLYFIIATKKGLTTTKIERNKSRELC